MFEVTRAILERLQSLSTQLSLSVAKKDEAMTKSTSDQMKSFLGVLELSWPAPELPRNFGDLRRHLEFVDYYTLRKNWEWVESNSTDCPKDLAALNAHLVPLEGRSRPRLRAEVDALPPSPARPLALEAIAALEAGAYRAAIVAAGASLESLARRTYEAATKRKSKGLDFNEVIKELEGLPVGGLGKEELAIVDLLRLYRNLTAHPSEFQNPEGFAPPLVELACNMLRQRSDAGRGTT